MKKQLLFGALLLASSAFAGEEIVVNGMVRLGVNTAAISLGVDEKHLGPSPVMIDVVRDGKPCLVLAHVERYGVSMARDVTRLGSITCEGEKPKEIKGWVYDEEGNLGVPQMLAGTKVKVAFVPDNNSTYTFK